MANKIKELDFSVLIPLEKPYLPRLLDSNFAEFIGIKTRTLFKTFEINLGFLDKDPSEWASDEKFSSAKDYVQNISCVNDYSERNVKLMSDYNKVWTQDEIEKRNLLQVVDVRENMKTVSKSKPGANSAFRKCDLKKI